MPVLVVVAEAARAFARSTDRDPDQRNAAAASGPYDAGVWFAVRDHMAVGSAEDRHGRGVHAIASGRAG